eukprot:TRINITY_DN11788_c0_g1_i1.p1 TRINITY_DN11788_c0_g1~~TRINITY_DN11788_c0_g1_i1.p1  ORF type:complete len:102 (-),score=28.92 TRINITY_DN11788_c0_g1_i1:93-398(-)
MLESLELNSRDPRGRELYVRHHQVYSLLELNVRLHQLKAGDGDISELDRAIQDVSVLISELVTRFEEAAVSYTHLRAHETVLDLVCRLLLEKKKKKYNNNN